MSQVLLIIPPNYSYVYDYPPLATPMLAGYLKTQGIAASQADLNLEYNRYIPQKISHLNEYFQEKRLKNLYYSRFLPEDSGELPYDDNTNSSFHFTERLLSSPHLRRYLRDEEENTFLRFFREKDIENSPLILNADIVGISIISPAQVIGAFTLADILKKKNPALPIVIGGQWPTLFRAELIKRADFGEFFDFIITFEGEVPLGELIKAQEGTKDFSEVPNLIYKSKSAFLMSKRECTEDLNTLACPDFDGLDLSGYKFPYTIPYQSSRECYWNKCAFCVDLPFPKLGYRVRDAKLVVSDLQALKNKYRITTIMFSDPAFSPRQMRQIAQGLLDQEVGLDWWVMARFEPAFTLALLKLASHAGCYEIDFGFETASGRLLEFLKKGVNRDIFERIIRDCYRAGLSVALQAVLGFPSETYDEALQTIAFLMENKDFIRGAAFNTYYLTPGNEIFENPQKFGISFEKDPELPFKFFYGYTHISGEVNTDAAKNFRKIYAGLLERSDARKKQKVIALEDHDEAYYHWRRLKIKGRTVIHIDAHLDFNWAESLKYLNMGNYLYFAIKEHMINTLYWVVPSPIWNNPLERKYLKGWLEDTIFIHSACKEQDGIITASLLEAKVVIGDIEQLPRFDQEVILDIDTDFFMTSSMAEADFPHRALKRNVWMGVDEFCAVIRKRFPFIESAVIAYSVRYGYTPIELKGMADTLLTKLSEMVR